MGVILARQDRRAIPQTGYSTEFELFGYAAAEAYRGRTGRELADLPELALPHPQEPLGGDWLRPVLKEEETSFSFGCITASALAESQEQGHRLLAES